MTEEYTLSRRQVSDVPDIAVVGCGGTGGFVAEGLCRLLGNQDARLLLTDHDRVEEHNLCRQSFYPGDVGKFKSQALAERLSRIYGREVWYSVYPFSQEMVNDAFLKHYPRGLSGLIIGCVDNAAAREAIQDGARSWAWWIDAGNGEHSGQVLIGNAKTPEELEGSFDAENHWVHRLPMPTLQEPSLLAPVTQPTTLNCAEAVEANLQSPVINQQMATLVLQFIARFLEGTLSWMGAYVDLEACTLRPVLAEPRTVARLVGVRADSLFRKQRENSPPYCPGCRRYHW